MINTTGTCNTFDTSTATWCRPRRITHAPKGNPAFVRLKRRIEAYVYAVERREQSVGCGFGQGLEEKAYAAQQALYDELKTLEEKHDRIQPKTS